MPPPPPSPPGLMAAGVDELDAVADEAEFAGPPGEVWMAVITSIVVTELLGVTVTTGVPGFCCPGAVVPGTGTALGEVVVGCPGAAPGGLDDEFWGAAGGVEDDGATAGGGDDDDDDDGAAGGGVLDEGAGFCAGGGVDEVATGAGGVDDEAACC